MLTEAQELQKELESILEEEIPSYISEKIISLIPSEYKKCDDEVHVKIDQVYSAGEYSSLLLLYDKSYESRLHSYGVKEELLFTYQDVVPGLLKEHKRRTNTGRFEKISEKCQPTKINSDISNIMLIKSTEWDTNIYDDKKVCFNIIVYNKDNYLELSRRQHAEKVLSEIKEIINKDSKETQKAGDLIG